MGRWGGGAVGMIALFVAPVLVHGFCAFNQRLFSK
jgi:hypothetical protein